MAQATAVGSQCTSVLRQGVTFPGIIPVGSYLALFDYKTGGIGRWYKSGISQQFDYTGPVGFDYSRQSGIKVVRPKKNSQITARGGEQQHVYEPTKYIVSIERPKPPEAGTN